MSRFSLELLMRKILRSTFITSTNSCLNGFCNTTGLGTGRSGAGVGGGWADGGGDLGEQRAPDVPPGGGGGWVPPHGLLP
jgi:hypothetical protein